MKRGIEQGSPVPMLLCIFVVKILAIQNRKSHEIHGLKFNANIDREYKIVQHAGGCTNMVKKINSYKKGTKNYTNIQ